MATDPVGNRQVREVEGDVTLNPNDYLILVYTSNGDITLTLPTAGLDMAFGYRIVDADGQSESNNITVGTEGSESVRRGGATVDPVSLSQNDGEWDFDPQGKSGSGDGDWSFSVVTQDHSQLQGVTKDQHHAEDHASRHSEGNTDEISVADLANMDPADVIIDTSGNRPSAGTADRIFIEQDNGRILRDTGSSWDEVGLSESQISLANLASRTHGDLSSSPASAHHTAHEHPGDQQATSDIEDDQANTLYDYSAQHFPNAIVEALANFAGGDSFTDYPVHNTDIQALQNWSAGDQFDGFGQLLSYALSNGKALADDGSLYDTVQGAENAASDYVFVGPGTFSESVTVDTAGLTIVGVGRGAHVDGGTTGHAFDIQAHNVTIRDLSAETSSGSGNNYDGIENGNGDNGDDLKLVNVRVRNSDRHGVNVDRNRAVIDNVTVEAADSNGINIGSNASDTLVTGSDPTAASGSAISDSGSGTQRAGNADGSLVTDDQDIGSSDFVATGDTFGQYVLTLDSQDASTSSNSYSSVAESLEARLQPDQLFPAGATIRASVSARYDANGDQIDIRFRDQVSGQVFVEETGITLDDGDKTITGTFTFNNPSSLNRILLDFRNGDGATTVRVIEPTIVLGVTV